MRALAAVLPAAGAAFDFREIELDPPRADEVQVRLVATGVCHTDAVIRDGWIPARFPIVLGHEGAGVVDRVGDAVTQVHPGDHVVLSAPSCGSCRRCLTGHPSSCVGAGAQNFGGGRLDGTSAFMEPEGASVTSHFLGQSSFASLVNVPVRAAVPVPKDVPLEILGPLGCGVQTGAGAVFRVLRPQIGDSIVIFGAGAVGLSAVLAAVSRQVSRVIAVDVHPARRDLAMSLGATHSIDGAAPDLQDQILEATRGGADVSLDTTGIPAVFERMIATLAPSGHAGAVAAPPGGGSASLDLPSSLGRGLRVSFILYGDSVPHLHIPELIELWRQGEFPFDRLIRRYPFAQLEAAFADSVAGTTIKPVVVF